ncbi:MAG TPA: HDIG domain-containing protein, partial [Anaerolineales bacterium]|nr:HDIG domain-containing protein [Anaerolineales bacterium]
PNSFYSEELTNAARLTAAETVEPVSRTVIAGERIVQRGQVLNSADLEALQMLGFQQPQRQWQELVSAATLALLAGAFFTFFFRRQSPKITNSRGLWVIVGLFLAFLFAGRLSLPGHIVLPYAFPLATYGLLISILFGFKISVVTSLPLAILIVFGMTNDMELLAYHILGTLFGMLAIGGARRLTAFFSAGTAIALSGVLVVLAYRLPVPSTDWAGLATLSGAALFNGLAATSLTLVLQFFLAQFLGLTTPMQLTELTRPDHPLLQSIMRDAPGTYQHSLQVANLAEQAAERIGADPLLTRVGALYHDAGKTQASMYFIENQLPGFANPHESLDPQSSSTIIIRHVTDGVELLRRYHLPKRLWDFILEHHGTTITNYQYVRAVEAAGGDESLINRDDYRYPGPRPQSRETAILMLADTCEAAVRAERPADEQALQRIIHGTVENRIATGQLDDTNLTLRDLATIADSFESTLRGIYHPRMIYPKLENIKPPQLPAAADVPTLTRGQVEERAAADATVNQSLKEV